MDDVKAAAERVKAWKDDGSQGWQARYDIYRGVPGVHDPHALTMARAKDLLTLAEAHVAYLASIASPTDAECVAFVRMVQDQAINEYVRWFKTTTVERLEQRLTDLAASLAAKWPGRGEKQ
jgi:hypothetical protein